MLGFSGVIYKLNYSINVFWDLNLLEVGERKNLTDTHLLKTAYRKSSSVAYGFKLKLPGSGLRTGCDLPKQLISSLPSVMIFLEIPGLLLVVWLNACLCLLSHDKGADVLFDRGCLAKGQKMYCFGYITGDHLRPLRVLEILCLSWNVGHLFRYNTEGCVLQSVAYGILMHF